MKEVKIVSLNMADSRLHESEQQLEKLLNEGWQVVASGSSDWWINVILERERQE